MDTNARPTVADFRRVAQLISFERPVQEIHDLFISEGWSEEDFFLVFKAGQRQVASQVTCDHGVPMKLTVRMRGAYFEPDTERCEPCRVEEDRKYEEQEAKTDAFLKRLAERRKAEGR